MTLFERRKVMNLRPLGDRVVIKPQKADEKTKGGIYLPETATKERPLMGTVVAVGSGKIMDNGQRASMEVKVNDEVIFSKYAGTEIKLDGEEYLIMREDDILAIS
jgi:chaperonin GroES